MNLCWLSPTHYEKPQIKTSFRWTGREWGIWKSYEWLTGQNKLPIKGSVHIMVMTAEIGTVPLQLYDALKIFLVYHISHFISSFVTCMLTGMFDLNQLDLNHWFKSWFKSNDFFLIKIIDFLIFSSYKKSRNITH